MADILKERDQVDLYHPQQNFQGLDDSSRQITVGYTSTATRDPTSYRELSMREDLRLDLRLGPRLQKLRQTSEPTDLGNKNWMVTEAEHKRLREIHERFILEDEAIDESGSSSFFFRNHPDLLEVVFRAMNPIDKAVARGNVGRFNFSVGRPGTVQDLRVGPIGGLVSLPGAADQALHADTPHLFEAIFKQTLWSTDRLEATDTSKDISSLPPHYINAFTSGCASSDRVGQTAFLVQTHDLAVTARYEDDEDSSRRSSSDESADLRTQLWKNHLVRPQLEPGDVILFDCRILHFGMANMTMPTSSSTKHCPGKERPILYTNMSMHWFHDPKNWDNQRPIFSGL